MSAPNEPSLRNSNTLLALQVISDFGDQITAALLALSVIDITKSTSAVGLVYLISTFGFVFFTFLGGYLGDRVGKKKILFYSDLGRGFVVLIMISALYAKSISLIYVASFLLSMLGSLHRPVKLSLWSMSVPRDRHEIYNCFSELSTHSSVIVGPLIAGLLLAHNIANWGFAFDALTFFICAFIFLIAVSDQPSSSRMFQTNSDVFAGFKLIFRNRNLNKFILYDCIHMVTHGAFNATLLVLMQRDYGWSKSEYSYHLAIAAAFAVGGATLGVWKYFANLSAVVRLASCTTLTIVFLALMLHYKTFPLASIFFGICNAVAVISIVISKTKVQMFANQSHAESLTSILAARSILIKATTLFGAGSCLVVENFYNLETTLWIFLLPLLFGLLPLASGLDFAFKGSTNTQAPL